MTRSRPVAATIADGPADNTRITPPTRALPVRSAKDRESGKGLASGGKAILSMPFRLILARKFYEEMVSHALSERPNECCGLLAGVIDAGVGRVVEGYPLVNVAETPAIEY